MAKKKNCVECGVEMGSNATHKDCPRCRTIRNRYGITKTQRDNMYHEQAGRCANEGCNQTVQFFNTSDPSRPKDVARAVIDHCHDTGEVRGILCHSCNVSLGLLDDDLDRILGLVKYLSK